MLKDLKNKALALGMKAMDTDAAKKVMSSDDFQSFAMKAMQTGFKVRQDLDSAKKMVAQRLNVATEDDLKSLKRQIDRLERNVRNLSNENEKLKAELETQKGE